MLNPQAITEFKEIYLKEHGVLISDALALEYGTKLIDLVKTVYGSNVPKEWKPKAKIKVTVDSNTNSSSNRSGIKLR